MTRSWTKKQKQYFEERVEAYSEMYGRQSPFHQAMTARLLEIAGIRKGMRVVELGCGVGRVTLPMLRLGCRVTAVDISASALARLSETARREGLAGLLDARCADAQTFMVTPPADAVLGRGIIHHLEKLEPFFIHARELLASGGRATFMDPNPLQPAWLPFVLFHPELSFLPERRLWRGIPTLIRRSMCAAGFGGVRSHFLGVIPPFFWSLAHLAEKLEDALRATPLKFLALYHVVGGCK